jgi:hypothetical protein
MQHYHYFIIHILSITYDHRDENRRHHYYSFAHRDGCVRPFHRLSSYVHPDHRPLNCVHPDRHHVHFPSSYDHHVHRPLSYVHPDRHQDVPIHGHYATDHHANDY